MDPMSGMGPMLQGPPTSSVMNSPFPVSLGATLGSSTTPGSPAKNFGSLPGPVSQAPGRFNPMQGLTSQLSGIEYKGVLFMYFYFCQLFFLFIFVMN